MRAPPSQGDESAIRSNGVGAASTTKRTGTPTTASSVRRDPWAHRVRPPPSSPGRRAMPTSNPLPSGRTATRWMLSTSGAAATVALERSQGRAPVELASAGPQDRRRWAVVRGSPPAPSRSTVGRRTARRPPASRRPWGRQPPVERVRAGCARSLAGNRRSGVRSASWTAPPLPAGRAHRGRRTPASRGSGAARPARGRSSMAPIVMLNPDHGASPRAVPNDSHALIRAARGERMTARHRRRAGRLGLPATPRGGRRRGVRLRQGRRAWPRRRRDRCPACRRGR
jgi:hypothetical protein